MGFQDKLKNIKSTAISLSATGSDIRNGALLAVKNALINEKDKIFEANKLDVKAAEDQGLSKSVIKRLMFDDKKLSGVVDGIDQLISLPDPIGKALLSRSLDEGLDLYRVSVPIGVICLIFESRPDALVQIASLCIKSGNCAVLKGGSETKNTNRILMEVISSAAYKASLPGGCLIQIEERSEVNELLSCSDSIDLIIPRGSNAFVQYIMSHTTIPVMGHADGVCHVYIDRSADIEKALKISLDAKTQYTSVCNACETFLIDKNIADKFLPEFATMMKNAGVTLHGNKEFIEKLNSLCGNDISCELMDDSDYHTEYLDYACSCKLVDDVDAAIAHINRFGSHHSDSIITEDKNTIDHFMEMVDSANVMSNCSTRFSDGFRYGFGAEVGISTGKLHARGPVGLEGLMTYKYKLFGNGQIVGDYASGKKQFHFRDM
ncbi:MAG: glutamate-5-semialdehyde dehydrogenase [Lachnospiraceae bacterium]|nr:glutamate-5-semialdehyde dehydrogenase [Lachnospiraceae bacterium]